MVMGKHGAHTVFIVTPKNKLIFSPETQVETSLTLKMKNMSSSLESVNSFLIEHSHQLETLESLVRTLTYILPGRFEDAEFASEALYACLNLIGLYHDTILAKKYAGSRPISGSGTGMSGFNKYTRWLHSTKPYLKTCSYALAFITYTEVFVEMGTRKFLGERAHYNCILLIELVKFVQRMVLLRESKGRMLLVSPVPERDHDLLNRDVNSSPQATWQQTRTGRPEPGYELDIGNANRNDVAEYLRQKALESTNLRAQDLVKFLSGESLGAEVVFWLRPVIYAWLLKRYGRKSWVPFTVSLTMEILALAGTREYLTTRVFKLPARRFTHLEREERKLSVWLLIYDLLRNPFYEKYTNERLLGFCNTVGRIPLVAIFSNILREYIPLWEQIYFYTSAS